MSAPTDTDLAVFGGTESRSRAPTPALSAQSMPRIEITASRNSDVEPMGRASSVLDHYNGYGGGGADDNAPFPPLYPTMVPTRDPSRLSNGNGGSSLLNAPRRLHTILRRIRKLNKEDLLLVTEMTQKRANRDVFSLLQYTGSAWYLPTVRPVLPDSDEKNWDVSVSIAGGFIVTLAGYRIELHPLSYCSRLVIMAFAWLFLWAALPSWIMEPGSMGYVFDPMITILVSAVIGGTICRLLLLPPLIGVLGVAIFWHNVPSMGYLTSGIRPEVRTIATRIGLTFILVRSGFALNIYAVRPMLKNVIALSFFPLALECVVHGLLANAVFDNNNYTWSFAQGMVCAIGSPAVIVPGVLLLQSQGYGIEPQGPLNLMLSSVGLDSVSGVWGASFILGLIFDEGKPLGLSIALGPIQIVAGVIIGVVLGICFHFAVEMFKSEAQRMPNGKYSPKHLADVAWLTAVMFISMALSLVFLGYKFDLAGGGGFAAMALGATVAHIWSKDADDELMEQKAKLGRAISGAWDDLVMPLLFAMVGTSVDVSSLFDGDFFPKALLIWFVSNVARFAAAAVATSGMAMPMSNRVLVGLAWLGKGAAQGALGGLALGVVMDRLDGAGGDPAKVKELDGAKRMALQIKNISVIFILFGVLISSLGLVLTGRRFLMRGMVVD